MFKAYLLLISLSITSLFAQVGTNETIDSLNQIINTTTSPAEKAHNLVLLSDQYQYSNLDTMVVICREALDIIAINKLSDNDPEKIDLLMAESEAYNNLGYVHLRKGNLEEAKKNLFKSLSISTDVDYHVNTVSAGINISLVFAEEGDYKSGIEILEKIKVIAENEGLTDKKATILNNIGWIYQVIMLYDASLSYYSQAYEIQKAAGNRLWMATSLSNMGIIYARLGNLDSAQYCYEEAFKIRTAENHEFGMANSYGNLAQIYLKQGDTVKAETYYQNSLNLLRELDLKRSWINTLNAYGKLAIAQGDKIKARSILLELDTLLPKYPTTSAKLEYYQFSYRYHELIGDLDRAYKDYKSYHAIRDSSQVHNTKIELYGRELILQNESEKALLEQKHKHELVIAEEKEKRKQLNFYIIIVVLAAISILISVLFFFLRQKQQLTRVNLELSRIKNEKLEADVEQKNKELTSYTLRVAQNNQFLQNLDDIISSLNTATAEDIEGRLNSMKNEIKINKRRDKDWLEFQKQFEGIHTSFIKNLTKKYPDLTTTEIRLCTLIKLNLSSKDISSVLGVSMNTLKSSRYRIHKKIGLDKGQELADYILKFE